MTELEQKQLLVDLIKTAAGNYMPESYQNLNANDSTFDGLKEQLDFLMRNRLQLVIDEIRTGNAESSKHPVLEPDKPYSLKEVVSFGNYLLSHQRYHTVLNHPSVDSRLLQDRLTSVSDADLKNWRDGIS